MHTSRSFRHIFRSWLFWKFWTEPRHRTKRLDRKPLPFAMLPDTRDTVAGHPFAQITLTKDSTQ
jgi:hypothetical protein